MPIAYPDILSLKSEPSAIAWTDRDAMLYALGIGLGTDPTDPRELAFVYEDGLKVVPTLATVLAWDQPLRPALGMDMPYVVHGAHKVVWNRPLPPAGAGWTRSKVVAVYEKGPDKGALVETETELHEGDHAEAAAVVTMTRFGRRDGGCGAPSGGGPAPHAVPDRTADVSLDIATRPDQALLYRLNGDRNPLHADPAAAARAGFPRPILHGLCTFGIVCRAVLRVYADHDPARLLSQEGRFSAPVFPGETLSIDLWRDGAIVSYEVRVAERGIKAMTGGRIALREPPGSA